MKPKVLVTRWIYPEAENYLRERVEVEYHPSGMSAGQLAEGLADKQGVVAQLTDKIDARLLAGLDDLKAIANVAVGYDNIDVKAATEHGILVTNTPDVLTETTADLAFSLMLAAARRIAESDRLVRADGWQGWRLDFMCGLDVHARTLGVFGMGRIGQAVARRARGFDMRVVYHDAQRLPAKREQDLQLHYRSADVLLEESDFISLHVPLSDQTRHLIDQRAFSKMKDTAILVNTSRGPVVDEQALVDALHDGTIAAAGLDVYEQEPKVHPGLLSLANAVLTPHIGSASVDTRRKMALMAAENLVLALEGKRPPNLVNTEISAR